MKEDKFEKVVKREKYSSFVIFLLSIVFIFLIIVSIISKLEDYFVGLEVGVIGTLLATQIVFYFKKRKVYWRKIK